MKDDQKNFLLFAVLAALILFGWGPITHMIFPQPPAPNVIVAGKSEIKPDPTAAPAADTPLAIRDRTLVLKESAGQRIAIDTPKLHGSINLKGLRIDDLVLKTYRETVAKDSPAIRLLSPRGTADAYFAGFGWQETGLKPPSPDTLWKADGTALTPGKPLTLTAVNDQGQIFRVKLSVDDAYMFTIDQTVANTGAGDVRVAPYSRIVRADATKEPDSWTIQVGPMSVHNGKADYDVNYSHVDEGPKGFESRNAWFGFTDKYWLTALIPDQRLSVRGEYSGAKAKGYQADVTLPQQLLAPGKKVTHTSHFFAGAKETATLDAYETSVGVPLFGKAIDWGWFEILEKPIFYYVDWLYRMIGNFGVAIILLTITIRGLLFPIANKQFASMANMRALQPKMKALQERHKDDKQRQQQEIMKLYKEEKVNPLAGCLPLLLQVPIMYALYKVLLLTIEMRHKPFTLWIHDLSAPDPATLLNLFGYLPFHPPSFLAIGVIPVLLGISMYYQIKLNPAPMDDMQKQIFAIMPWMLMFVMAPFAVGLQIYWITSNCITILQQRWLYSRHPAMKLAMPKKEPAAK